MGFGLGVSPDQRAMEAQIDEEMLALVTQLTNEVNWHMRERGLTRADLAARMGVSPGRVSQILGGGENLTLRTLAALSSALDARFDIELTSSQGRGHVHQPRCRGRRSGPHPKGLEPPLFPADPAPRERPRPPTPLSSTLVSSRLLFFGRDPASPAVVGGIRLSASFTHAKHHCHMVQLCG